MSKMRIFLFSLLAVFVMAFSFTLGIYIASMPDKEIVTESSDKDIYVIKDYEGKIAVFDEKNMKTPLRIMDVELTQLREVDAEMIRNGIRLEGLDELASALEDYIS